MGTYYQYPYYQVSFDPDDKDFLPIENDAGPSSGGVNVGPVNNQNLNSGLHYSYYGGASHVVVRNPSPTHSESNDWYDNTLTRLILKKNPEPTTLCGRLGTFCQRYKNFSEKYAHHKTLNLAVSLVMVIKSLIFIVMGLVYMNKCESSTSFPIYCTCLGGAGFAFAVSNVLMLVESCRIRDRCNLFEWLTAGILLFYVIFSAVALWRITLAELDSTLVVENADKCDPIFANFFKISTAIGTAFTALMAVFYLPLLFCCRRGCHCHRCC